MQRGMVVAPQNDAAEVGARIFLAGGNAVDAAVATAFAQGVMDQMMCGIAGFGAGHVYLPKLGVHAVINFFSKAPLAVRPDMWRDLLEYETRDGFGFVLKGRVNDLGYQAVAVPGTIAGLHGMHKLYGRLPWAEVVLPAARIAEEGYRITPHVHNYWTTTENMGRVELIDRIRYTKEYAALFFGADGQPHAPGTTVTNPDYGRSLRTIAADGPAAFYHGAIGDRIAEDFAARGGLLAKADLEQYEAEWTPPVWGSYRGLRVSSNPPPGCGAMLLRMLHILEHFDLKALGVNTPEYIRVVAEAMKRAQIVKDRDIGDPRFVDVPAEAIFDREAARADAEAIRRGEVAHVPRAGGSKEGADTTHLCTLDSEGNAVSMTHTLGMQSGVITPGLGFMYNGAMAMFDPRPGRAQSLAPNKRRVSSMSPSILFKGDKPYLILGAPGGSNIPMGILQVILNVVDHGMSVVEAVNAPRFSATGDVIDVASRIPVLTCEALAAMGYRTIRSVQPYICARVHAILVEGDRVTGGADPSTGGSIIAV
ncbi:gamma-glutamyltransferase [Stella sp.]|uniref:gamma-glutamyltransferase n=1 Tax=Stella sp. TaxID=2912054 RepID=UPI0035B2CA61